MKCDGYGCANGLHDQGCSLGGMAGFALPKPDTILYHGTIIWGKVNVYNDLGKWLFHGVPYPVAKLFTVPLTDGRFKR